MNRGYFDAFRQIYNIENLYHAWIKAKNIYDNECDFIVDRVELIDFEVNLSERLKELSDRIKNGTYELTPLKPMSLPKGKDKDVGLQSRQNFHITLQDQVVWIAVVNIIGPILDNKMPFWSFGNRLYMPIWKEINPNTNKKETRYGQYRHSSRQIYRKWTSSWPLFRKAVSITVKQMSKSELDGEEEDEKEYNDNAPESMTIKYWDREYWKILKEHEEVFYASIDFSKFYPKISNKLITSKFVINKIYHHTSFNEKDKTEFKNLINKILDFTIDKEFSDCDSDEIFPRYGDTGEKFTGIPTGLMVAGFLSNIAMLELDSKINGIIEKNRKVAHFRFVDDHVFLATSVDELVDWINKYEELVKKLLPNIEINSDKTKPPALADFIKDKNPEDEKEAYEKCKLDTKLPSPFITLTLRKMSNLNKSPVDVMDEEEKLGYIREIEHILVTEFPEDEIKKETRVSWAASMLTRVAPTVEFDVESGYKANKGVESVWYEIEQNIKIRDEWTDEYKTEKISKVKQNLPTYEKGKETHEKLVVEKMQKLNDQIFNLLCKALRDNISKPNIWKKLVGFCRTTGYKGIKKLLEILNEDHELTYTAHCYIFATLLCGMMENLLTCLKIQKSKNYNNFEKEKAQRFYENIGAKEFLDELSLIKQQYNNFYVCEVYEQFVDTYNYVECELSGGEYDFELKNSKKLYFSLCQMWHYTTATIEAFKSEPCKVMVQLYSTFDDNMKINDDKCVHIIKKMLLMYPKLLTYKHASVVPYIEMFCENDEYLATPKGFNSTGKTNLFKWYIDIKNKKYKVNKNEFDTRHSEWVALEICRQVLEIITKSSEFSFSESKEAESKFVCGNPVNFWLKDDEYLYSSINRNWEQTKEYFGEEVLSHEELLDDFRYESTAYTHGSVISHNQKQVYSIAILLINLLTFDFSFNPLINRGERIEKSYYLILEKLDRCNVSSYTRAILMGCLSYRNFEKQYLTMFDIFFKRNEDWLKDPIDISDVHILLEHIKAAKSTLEKYQMSIEGGKPRQLIPVSFRNFTYSFKPYDNGGTSNE